MITLVVALPPTRPTPGTEFAYGLSRDGRHATSHGTAPLALLPRADSLVLVVPAQLLSWHQVRLPPLAPSRLRAALDGILEERVLDDVAHLALALGPRQDRAEGALVAVCDKAWLRAALEFFEQGQRAPNRVAPEIAPTQDAQAQVRMLVIGTPDQARLVVAQPQGVSVLPLDAASLAAFGDGVLGDDVPVLCEPALAQIAEQLLGRPVEIQTVAERLVDSARNGWELAQFDLAISGSGRMARRWSQATRLFWSAPQWRIARWASIALLLANLAGLNAWAWKQDADLRAGQDAVRALLQQTFPQVRTIVDAPLQMERELALLRRSSGVLSGADLETILAALGSALPAGKYATAIDFAPRETVAKGIDLPASDLEALRAKLLPTGLAAVVDGDRLVLRTVERP